MFASCYEQSVLKPVFALLFCERALPFDLFELIHLPALPIVHQSALSITLDKGKIIWQCRIRFQRGDRRR